MRERPILFNGEMVRAILDGKKTQTRRMVKCSKPIVRAHPPAEGDDAWLIDHEDIYECNPQNLVDHSHITCPFGRVGDRLWVRETFAIHEDNGLGCEFTQYRADGEDKYTIWKPSIHMPRWLSRITLEITDVRVERLQDISEADAFAEGVRSDKTRIWVASDLFKKLWQSVYGEASWNNNPWVWVVEFKKI